MAEAVISKEEIMAVFPTVQKTMADALGCDVDDIKLDVSLIEGLDALGVKSLEFMESSATPEWLQRPVSSGHGSRGWKCSRDTGTNHGPSR